MLPSNDSVVLTDVLVPHKSKAECSEHLREHSMLGLEKSPDLNGSLTVTPSIFNHVAQSGIWHAANYSLASLAARQIE